MGVHLFAVFFLFFFFFQMENVFLLIKMLVTRGFQCETENSAVEEPVNLNVSVDDSSSIITKSRLDSRVASSSQSFGHYI